MVCALGELEWQDNMMMSDIFFFGFSPLVWFLPVHGKI